MKAPYSKQTREQRAGVFFALYAQMGTGRSIDGLANVATSLGLAVTRTTLARYSSMYGWKERVDTLDAERAQLEDTPAARVAKMNERQAATARLLQEVGGNVIKGAVERAAEISPRDGARIFEIGVRAERLAMGEATSRSEIYLRVYTELVPAMVVAFQDAILLVPPEFRAEPTRKYLLAVDALVDAHIDGSPLDARVIADESATSA